MDNVEEAWEYITSTKKKYDIFNEVEEPRAVSVSNKTNEITQISNKKKTVEVIISQENLDISVLSGLGASLASITPDQKDIPRKNKRK